MDKSRLQKCINNLETYAKKYGLVVSMKKTKVVSTKYTRQYQCVYDNEPIPFKTFYKYLGAEIRNNREFKSVRKERATKAYNAIFATMKTPATSRNVSIKLAMNLFDSNKKPILTYDSIIWGIESSNNSVSNNGLRENSGKSTHDQVMEHLRQILTERREEIGLETVERIGRKNKKIQNRTILVKFKDYETQEKILFRGKCNLNSVPINDNCSSSTFKEIQPIQDNFTKFALNLPKNCSNFISRSEVGKFSVNVKIWS